MDSVLITSLKKENFHLRKKVKYQDMLLDQMKKQVNKLNQ